MNNKLFVAMIIIIIALIAIFSYNSRSESVNNSNLSGEDLSYNNWTYDKKEYPKENYTLEEICPPHTQASSIKQFFDDSDFNHDGLLSGREISAMDYKLKHSQYTYNGPFGYN